MNSINSWYLNTIAISHISNTLQGFQKNRKLSENEVITMMGTKASVATIFVRTYHLVLQEGVLNLKDCLYVSKMRRNLIFYF